MILKAGNYWGTKAASAHKRESTNMIIIVHIHFFSASVSQSAHQTFFCDFLASDVFPITGVVLIH